jgi:hypothetical protein
LRAERQEIEREIRAIVERSEKGLFACLIALKGAGPVPACVADHKYAQTGRAEPALAAPLIGVAPLNHQRRQSYRQWRRT